ncbi:DUF4381 domain-containing protein [Microbulbifer spongiae]|uniref:DUF4381 domain-containing protein n=1 Tax=Microbulbifer spongiae TaxID=2944933 RepID=A0ABY9EEB7_9GAMM|nr:DUF4381 domain-containing protein [Microbulbifer sp. MI-G]WKD51315.1 DUF4381 domain-containing protein [Microbulbifer sp. MI-G]
MLRGTKRQQTPAPSPQARELLAQLHDIREPASVSWWPPAPGWWLLAALISACLVGVCLGIVRRRIKARRNRYRVEAVALLRAVDTSQSTASAEMNEILKRVAVTSFGRMQCANLTGPQWLTFLQNTAPLPCPSDARQVLLEQLYRGTDDPEKNNVLREYAIGWVEQHGHPAQGMSSAEPNRETGRV